MVYGRHGDGEHEGLVICQDCFIRQCSSLVQRLYRSVPAERLVYMQMVGSEGRDEEVQEHLR